MPTDYRHLNESAWFMYHAMNNLNSGEFQRTAERVGNIYAGEEDGIPGNGVDAVREAVLAEKSAEITRRSIDDIDDEIERFNEVTSNWSISEQAHLAGYEVRNAGDDRNDGYMEKVREFAEIEGTTDNSPEETELDTEYSLNPHEDDRLTPEEADSVLLLRGLSKVNPEIDISSVISRVDDHLSFRHCICEEEMVVDEAIMAQHFNGSIPSSVLQQLAPIDEWPGGAPNVLNSRRCEYCSTTFYRGVTGGGEENWVGENGSITGEVILSTEDSETPLYHASDVGADVTPPPMTNPNANALCSHCLDASWRDTAHRYVFGSESGLHKVFIHGNMLYDAGHDSDSFVSVSEEFISDIFTKHNDFHSSSDAYMSLAPTADASSPVSAQREFIREIVEGEETTSRLMDNNIYVYTQHGGPGSDDAALYCARDADDAIPAKEILETAEQCVR